MNSVNAAGKRIKKNPTRSSRTKRALLTLFALIVIATFGAAVFLWRSPALKLNTAIYIQKEFTNESAQSAQEKATGRNRIALHLWDYSLLFHAQDLEGLELELPYAKGPPERLLSSIIFRDQQTKETVLELHGKRPRTLNAQALLRFFPPEGAREISRMALWGDAELREVITALNNEAAISPLVKELSLIKVYPAPQPAGQAAVGDPFLMVGELSDQNAPLSFIYLKSDGAIFQVRCKHHCSLRENLMNAIFSADAKLNLASRKSFSLSQVQAALHELLPEKTPTENLPAADSAKLLPWFLASYLTLDPRDPEAYFHLGKIATNSITQSSALQYAKDVGLEEAKLLELSSSLNPNR